MNIHFNNIMPTPLASIKHDEQSIWGRDLVLEAGKHIVLNASSGKGKSTFTMVTTGLRKDYAGVISYDERDIKSITPSEWADIRKDKISVVFQDLQLFPKLSVRENLVLKNNLTEEFSEGQMLEMLEKLGIENKWEQQCGLLSMGQQQRVAIVRALIQPYKWLLLDEPFSHLDEENSQIALKLIEERTRAQRAGFVLTTLGDYHGYKYDVELKL